MSIENTRSLVAEFEAAIARGELNGTAADQFLAPYRAEIEAWDRAERERQDFEAFVRQQAGVVAYGTRDRDPYGDSKTRWFVLTREGRRPQRLRGLEHLGVAYNRVPCHTHAGDCCGRFFSYGATIRRTATRILVTCTWSRDV